MTERNVRNDYMVFKKLHRFTELHHVFLLTNLYMFGNATDDHDFAEQINYMRIYTFSLSDDV